MATKTERDVASLTPGGASLHIVHKHINKSHTINAQAISWSRKQVRARTNKQGALTCNPWVFCQPLWAKTLWSITTNEDASIIWHELCIQRDDTWLLPVGLSKLWWISLSKPIFLIRTNVRSGSRGEVTEQNENSKPSLTKHAYMHT